MFATLAALTLTAAKLSGLIDWSWWWVAVPIWLPTGLGVAVCVYLLVMVLWHRVKHAFRPKE